MNNNYNYNNYDNYNSNQYNYNQEYRQDEKRGGKIIGLIIAIVIIIIIILLLLKYCGVGILTGINIENSGIIYVDENKHINISALGTGDRSNTRFNFSIINDDVASLREDYQIGNEVEAIVKGLEPGETTLSVTAELGNVHKSERADIVVCDKLEVSNILDRTITVTIGKIKYISLDLGPSERCYANLRFDFGNNTIAKRVGDNGIEGLEVGKTTLTISDDLGNSVDYDLVVINPNGKVLANGIKLNTKSVSVCIGKSKTLKATITPSNVSDKSVIWESDDLDIATIKNGKIVGRSLGTTKISVTTQDGSNKSATANVKVIKCKPTSPSTKVKVKGIKFDKSSASIYVGDSETLTTTITPSNATNKTITCTSSNNGIATVSTSGNACVVKGVAVGSVTITATTKDGNKKASATITVSKKPSTTIAVTGISFDKESESMYVGDSKTLTTTIIPSNATNKTITCASGNNSIATVSTSGNACVVKGVAVGNVTITATTKDGNIKATITVKVSKKPSSTIKVTSITLSPSSKTIYVGDSATISVGILPTNATNQTVTCSSLNTTIFTASASGKSCVIKGVKAGTATLSVTANDGSGVKATASITVKSSGGGETSGGQCYCCGGSQGCNYKWSSDGSSPGNTCGKVNKTQAQCVGSTTKECNITGCVECDSNNKCTRCNELKGYILDGKGGCKQQCNVTRCETYRSTNPCDCSKCINGYFVVNSNGQKCCPIRPNCVDFNPSDCTCKTCDKDKGYVSDGNGGCKEAPVYSGTCVCYKSTYGGKCTKIYGSGQMLITSCLNYCYGSNVCLQHSDGKYYCTENKSVSGAAKSSCSELYGSGWTGTLEKETTQLSCGTYSNCTSVCGSHSMNVKSGSCK